MLRRRQRRGNRPIAEVKPNDYRDDSSWLCRPGRKGDACDVDLTTTIVAADGTLARETFAADPKAPIDCFYVYPTVSTDKTQNSDMTADPAEKNVILQQFARFASKCRTFAPMYRQITLIGLQQYLGQGRSRHPVRHRRAIRRCARCVAALPEERQPGPRRRAGRPLAGLVHSRSADCEGDRRQADSEAAGRRVHPRRDIAHAEGQGRRRAVQADSAVPQARTDRLRRQLFGVPIDGDASRQHAVWQQPGSGAVGIVHEPRDAGIRQRAAARVSVDDRQNDCDGRRSAEAVGRPTRRSTRRLSACPAC